MTLIGLPESGRNKLVKIGFFTYGIYGDRMTGIARYTVELTRALKKLDAGLEIILLSPYPQSSHPWYREFPVYPLPHLKKMPIAATLGNLELDRAAIRMKLDVLHDPCGIAPFLSPRRGYKKVTTIHDALPAVYPKTQPLLTRLVFSTFIARAGKTCDAILTVSQTSAKDLTRYYGFPAEMIQVTPNGVVPPDRLPSELIDKVLKGYGASSPYFLYVGALHPRKNIRRVIEAFKLAKTCHNEINLVIVGPSSWGAHHELQTVLGSTGNSTGIIFTGFLSDEDLGALYQGAYGLVFPSLYEGFGLPVLEAMSYGTPVITSNISALPEVAGDAALLVDPMSVTDIARKMVMLLEDADLHADLQGKGYIRCKKFSWDETARRTYDVYKSLLVQSAQLG